MEKQRIYEKDLQMAVNVQRTFLPSGVPFSDKWDVSFVFRPMSGVSGDFYDFFVKDETLCGMGLFDVSGHGIASGLITMIAKSIVFRSFNEGYEDDLGSVMKNINDHLREELKNSDNYLTGILLRLEEDSMSYVIGGHPDIICKKSGSSSVTAISSSASRGGLLGIHMWDIAFQSEMIQPAPGDMFLIYSDGFIEGENPQHEEYLKRLPEVFQSAPDSSASEALAYLLSDYEEFTRHSQEDDVTVICMKYM